METLGARRHVANLAILHLAVLQSQLHCMLGSCLFDITGSFARVGLAMTELYSCLKTRALIGGLVSFHMTCLFGTTMVGQSLC